MIFTPLEKVVWVYIEMLVGVLKLPSQDQERERERERDREREQATLASTWILELKLDLKV